MARAEFTVYWSVVGATDTLPKKSKPKKRQLWLQGADANVYLVTCAGAPRPNWSALHHVAQILVKEQGLSLSGLSDTLKREKRRKTAKTDEKYVQERLF